MREKDKIIKTMDVMRAYNNPEAKESMTLEYVNPITRGLKELSLASIKKLIEEPCMKLKKPQKRRAKKTHNSYIDLSDILNLTGHRR